MMDLFYSLMPAWMVPTAPMLAPVGLYMAMKEGEEEDPPAVVVTVKDSGKVEVEVFDETVLVPEPLPPPRRPLRSDPLKREKESSGIRQLREAREGVREAEGNLDNLIEKFKKKSGEMRAITRKPPPPKEDELEHAPQRPGTFLDDHPHGPWGALQRACRCA